MGSVVISVDAELGWGFHDLADPPTQRLETAREGWRQLLDLFDTYNIPATWAVVGHLLLDSCDRRHPGHPTPPGWFEAERNGWKAHPEYRYGEDLMTRLVDADVEHDIGCHTFSHVVFDKEWLTRDIVRAELDAACDAATEWGIDYDSFIFPRNAVGYRDILADYGFTTYRGEGPQLSRIREPIAKCASVLAPDLVDLTEPSVDEYGLVDVPPSLFLFEFEGPVRTMLDSIWVDPVVRRATTGIDQALTSDGIFHMWLHPNNIRSKRDIRRLSAIFEHIERRRADDLSVETMADVGEAIV